MRDSPPGGFVDFVVERGPALHRTAVLLTRQEHAAEDLVQIALAKTWQSWTRIDGNHEAYVRRIMINEFASDLPGRLRAVVVLRFFHNYSEAATAEAMGTRVGTVRSRTVDALAALRISEELSEDAAPDLAGTAQAGDVQAGDVPPERTLDDLRGALHAEADAAAYPDVEALVAGARRRVAATRRRRLSALGATAVAVLAIGGLIAATSATHQALPPPALPQPGGLGPFTVNTGGAGFPEYSQGMKRLTVVDAPMLERAKGSISVRTTAGSRLGVRMTCTPTDNLDNMNEWDVRMLARFTVPDGTGQAHCGLTGSGTYQIGIAVAAKTTVLANVFVSHEPSPGLPSLFTDAQIHVAIYESVPWEDYHFPPRPADLDTNPEYAWWSGPGTVRVLGPKTVQEANQPFTFTQPFDEKLGLNMQVRGPGRMRVLINGKDIGRQLDDRLLTQGTFISFWGYNSTGFSLPVDSATAFDPTGTTGLTTPPGSPVTVTIEPRDFQGPDWRITVEPTPSPG